MVLAVFYTVLTMSNQDICNKKKIVMFLLLSCELVIHW